MKRQRDSSQEVDGSLSRSTREKTALDTPDSDENVYFADEDDDWTYVVPKGWLAGGPKNVLARTMSRIAEKGILHAATQPVDVETLDHAQWMASSQGLSDAMNVVIRCKKIEDAKGRMEMALPLYHIVLYLDNTSTLKIPSFQVQPLSAYSTLRSVLHIVAEFVSFQTKQRIEVDDLALCVFADKQVHQISQADMHNSIMEMKLETEVRLGVQLRESGGTWPLQTSIYKTLYPFAPQDHPELIITATGHGSIGSNIPLPMPKGAFEIVLPVYSETPRHNLLRKAARNQPRNQPEESDVDTPNASDSTQGQASPERNDDIIEPLPKPFAFPPLRERTPPPPKTRGVKGLSNLGNTCFMNSALQCLSNTEPLIRYFTDARWISDINKDNPLGMKGELATEFAGVMYELWKSEAGEKTVLTSSFRFSEYVSPSSLKAAIGRFNNSFSGYYQHDAQELLTFLLDGIHEDLNRIIKKPYVEMPSMTDASDDEVAAKTWELHQKRNSSVIVDHFQGQYKSKVKCGECGHVGITFDPFMYLTVPVLDMKMIRRVFQVIPLPNHSDPDDKNFRGLELSATGLQSAQMHVVMKQVMQRTYDYYHREPPTSRPNTPMPRRGPNYVVMDVYNQAPWRCLEEHDTFGAIDSSDVCYVFELEDAPTVLQRLSGLFPGSHGEITPETGAMLPDGPVFAWIERARIAMERDLQNKQNLEVFPLPVTFTTLEGANVFQPFVISVPQRMWLKVSVPVNATEELICALAERKLATCLTDELDYVLARFTNNDDVEVKLRGSSKISIARLKSQCRSLLSPLVPDYEPLKPTMRSWHHGNRETFDLRRPRKVEDVEHVYVDYCVEFSKSDIIRVVLHPRYINSVALPAQSHPWVQFTDTGTDKLKQSMDKNEPLTLGRCLREFAKEEPLEDDNAWYCPKCKKHQKSTKKLDVWKAPEILIVHLKRFSNSGTRWSQSTKVDTVVEFPVEGLDLNKYVLHNDGQPDHLIYDLYAVSNHFGGTGGGHYTAYAKNFIDAQWYQFDDSRTCPATPEEVVTAGAYLLFYRRRATVSHLIKELAEVVLPCTERARGDTPSAGVSSMSIAADTPVDRSMLADRAAARIRQPFATPSTSPHPIGPQIPFQSSAYSYGYGSASSNFTMAVSEAPGSDLQGAGSDEVMADAGPVDSNVFEIDGSTNEAADFFVAVATQESSDREHHEAQKRQNAMEATPALLNHQVDEID